MLKMEFLKNFKIDYLLKRLTTFGAVNSGHGTD
jgi:hypothetical protein